MRLFYAPDIEGKEYTFNAQESKHIAKVLRYKNGDKLLITDGKGWFYESEIVEISQKLCSVEILKKEEQKKHSYYLHIAIAPTKSIDRFEWFLEKATEIGIDEITPLLTKNSERKQIKDERLQKVIESAMKQSYKAHHPKLNPLITFEEFISKDFIEGQKYITHCYDSKKGTLKDMLKSGGSTLILIGPEGDFSIEEVGLAKDFMPLSLGDYRLRTETAGIVAVQSLAFINS